MDFIEVTLRKKRQQLMDNLKTRRLIKQYTQEYLAHLCGTSRVTISRIEKGDDFSWNVFLRMCHHLNCLDEVVNATDPMNNTAMLHAVVNAGVKKRAKKINTHL